MTPSQVVCATSTVVNGRAFAPRSWEQAAHNLRWKRHDIRSFESSNNRFPQYSPNSPNSSQMIRSKTIVCASYSSVQCDHTLRMIILLSFMFIVFECARGPVSRTKCAYFALKCGTAIRFRSFQSAPPNSRNSSPRSRSSKCILFEWRLSELTSSRGPFSRASALFTLCVRVNRNSRRRNHREGPSSNDTRTPRDRELVTLCSRSLLAAAGGNDWWAVWVSRHALANFILFILSITICVRWTRALWQWHAHRNGQKSWLFYLIDRHLH